MQAGSGMAGLLDGTRVSHNFSDPVIRHKPLERKRVLEN
jgi:hypothetical protein